MFNGYNLIKNYCYKPNSENVWRCVRLVVVQQVGKCVSMFVGHGLCHSTIKHVVCGRYWCSPFMSQAFDASSFLILPYFAHHAYHVHPSIREASQCHVVII